MTVYLIEGRDNHTGWKPARNLDSNVLSYRDNWAARDALAQLLLPHPGTEFLHKQGQRYRLRKVEYPARNSNRGAIYV